MNTQISLSAGFFLLYKVLQYKFPKKQASNLTSASHALGSTILSCIHLSKNNQNYFSFLQKFSTAYFLHDTVQMLCNNKITFSTLCYIYHHIAATYLLHGSVESNIIGQIFFWGELSNWPTYLLYHYLHKKGNHKNAIKILKIMQRIVYICIRIPILTHIIRQLVQEKKNNIDPTLLGLIPVYFMGLGWSYKIFINN